MIKDKNMTTRTRSKNKTKQNKTFFLVRVAWEEQSPTVWDSREAREGWGAPGREDGRVILRDWGTTEGAYPSRWCTQQHIRQSCGKRTSKGSWRWGFHNYKTLSYQQPADPGWDFMGIYKTSSVYMAIIQLVWTFWKYLHTLNIIVWHQQTFEQMSLSLW